MAFRQRRYMQNPVVARRRTVIIQSLVAAAATIGTANLVVQALRLG